MKCQAVLPVAPVTDRTGWAGASDEGQGEADNDEEENDLDEGSDALQPSERVVWQDENDEANDQEYRNYGLLAKGLGWVVE